MRKTLDVFEKGEFCFTLIEETLSDDSKGYNIGISLFGKTGGKAVSLYNELNFQTEWAASDCFIALKAAM
jgi:hypothetical protein